MNFPTYLKQKLRSPLRLLKNERRDRGGSEHDRGKGNVIHWPRPAEVAESARRLPWHDLGRIGPSIVTGTSDVDPALVLTATVVGATFGYSLLWVVALAVPFLLAVFSVSARIGHETHRGLVDLICEHYGKPLAIGCALLIVVINMAMIGADLLAVTDALGIILGQPRIYFVAAAAFTIWYVLIFRDYHKITRILVFFSLPVFAYVVAAVLAKPDLGQMLSHTLLPRMQRGPGFAAAVIGLLGSLLTPYVIVWQTSSRREQAKLGGVQEGQAGHRTGTFVTTVLSYSIIVAAATLMPHHSGSDFNTAQAAEALSPLGQLGPVVFALGIVASGFVALPVLVASLCFAVSEAFGWRYGLSEHPWEAKSFYVLISASLFTAAAFNFLTINPVKALYASQILAGALTVPILLFILLVANDRRIMRTTNTRAQNFWIGAAVGCLCAMGLLVAWWKITG